MALLSMIGDKTYTHAGTEFPPPVHSPLDRLGHRYSLVIGLPQTARWAIKEQQLINKVIRFSSLFLRLVCGVGAIRQYSLVGL